MVWVIQTTLLKLPIHQRVIFKIVGLVHHPEFRLSYDFLSRVHQLDLLFPLFRQYLKTAMFDQSDSAILVFCVI